MADASRRAALEAAQARRASLDRELGETPALPPEQQLLLSEVEQLRLRVSTLEGQLTEAIRLEDEVLQERAGKWNLIDLGLSATVTLLAALPSLAVALAASAISLPAPAALAGGAVLLAVPLAVNGLRHRRGARRAAASNRLRAALR